MTGNQDINLLYDILRLSAVYYHLNYDKKVFLIENLNKLAVWSDRTVWNSLFDHFCRLQQERAKVQEEKASQKTYGGYGNVFNMAASTFKKIINQDEKPELSPKMKESALEELGLLLFNLAFRFEFIAEALMQVVEDFDLDRKVAIKILKKNEEKLVKELFEKLKAIDLENTSRDKMLAMKLIGRQEAMMKACQYLDCNDVLEFGLMSKNYWQTVKPVLVDRVLLAKNDIPHEVRMSLWNKYVLPKYENEKLQKLELTEDDEIIILDVKRTYPHHKNFNKDVLINILKNVKVKLSGFMCYYQGMNYVVGYLLNVTKDPTFTYRLTLSLMEKHFSSFVSEDLSGMKLAFYIFNRVLQIYLPDLHLRLKNEKVGVDIFSASWFLTVFTTVSQSDPDSQTLLAIFDIFVAGGWLAFYRVLVVIMAMRAKEVEKLAYEDIMMVYFNICKSDLFRDSGSRRSLKDSFVNSERGEDNSGRSTSLGMSSETTGEKRMSVDFSTMDAFEQNVTIVDIKTEANKIPLDRQLIDNLIFEYRGVAQQIAAFWLAYDNDSLMASPIYRGLN